MTHPSFGASAESAADDWAQSSVTVVDVQRGVLTFLPVSDPTDMARNGSPLGGRRLLASGADVSVHGTPGFPRFAMICHHMSVAPRAD